MNVYRSRITLVALMAFLIQFGCTHSPVARMTPEPERCHENVCRGFASWYGKDFHGRKTANGETYNMYGLSAAHRTLPLGTRLKVALVENLQGRDSNPKSVVVKVNDRGPFIPGRVLDLSYGAASALGIVQKGTAEVIYSVVEIPTGAPTGSFTVQAGAFYVKDNARLFQEKIERELHQQVRVVSFDSPSGLFFRVRVGLYASEAEAQKVAGLLQKENGIIPFVVKEDNLP